MRDLVMRDLVIGVGCGGSWQTVIHEPFYRWQL